MSGKFIGRISRSAAVAFALVTLAAGAAWGQAATGAAWKKIVDAAKKEGAVTFYSSQGLVLLQDVAEKFKKEYGITVTVVRGVDSDNWPKIDAEIKTGRGIADLFVATDLVLIRGLHDRGQLLAPMGPAFDNPAYNRKVRIPSGTYFETNAFVVAFGWNKDLYPKGINGYADMLDPALSGKIGVPNPTVAALVDFYLFLEQNFGEDFVVKLAALKPRIYPGALPLAQAVTSGEIAVASYTTVLSDEQKKGAPVEWRVPAKSWGARFYAQILKTGPHPNAAQLLANYLVTPAGQAAIARTTASALPNIPETLGVTDGVHRGDPAKLQPEPVKAYQEKWRKLFVQ